MMFSGSSHMTTRFLSLSKRNHCVKHIFVNLQAIINTQELNDSINIHGKASFKARSREIIRFVGVVYLRILHTISQHLTAVVFGRIVRCIVWIESNYMA